MATNAVPRWRLLAATARRRGGTALLQPCWSCRRHREATSMFIWLNRRYFSISPSQMAKKSSGEEPQRQWDEYKLSFHFPSATPRDSYQPGADVAVHGFLGRRRDISARQAFVDVIHPGQPRPVQIRSAWEVEGSPEHDLHLQLKATAPYSAVVATGTVEDVAADTASNHATVRLSGLQILNAFPRDIIVSKGVNFPATARHLQMRFSEALQRRLAFRDDVTDWSCRMLRGNGFQGFETPTLFKSTPEGAREFIVPTRRRGYAYALPQSPQQFKQILMASGAAGGYFQFARCYRDEDLRADRQPEFTQLDLEMAFATGEDVMKTVERYIKRLLAYVGEKYRLKQTGDELVPISLESVPTSKGPTLAFPTISDASFARMPYDVAMAKYGSDKPDLRIPGEIHRLEHMLPGSFTSMITSLEDPIVEACRFRLEGSPKENREFVRKLFDALPPAIAKNTDGMPAVMIYDSSKPMCGLAPLGHEAFEALTSGEDPELAGLADFDDGDILFLQARKSEPFFSGGSTALGVLRLEAYRAAVEQGLLPRNDEFKFLWVVGFPMFTAHAEDGTDADPGQGGRAGFSATHHPFTAPLTPEDFDLLATDPLRAKADHYDLVVNGVELGGGSRRIHAAAVQEFVLRDILQMDDRGVAQFAHLLEALRAGCPPHAGFALGFDRLIAVLSGTNSVRDVIAFPKSMKGEDLSVKSPGRMTPAQLETYHLSLRPAAAKDDTEK